MDPPSERIENELDSFREQWRAEVSSRAKTARSSQPQAARSQAGPSSAPPASASGPNAPAPRAVPVKQELSQKAAARLAAQLEEEDDYFQGRSFDEPTAAAAATAASKHDGGAKPEPPAEKKEPETALEYYEKAVERESTGKLGDSLSLYRKAFRMDSRVDQLYKAKYFPKPAQAIHSKDHVTAPKTTSTADGAPLAMPELIASFAGLCVLGAPPAVEGMDAPPCPIAELPDEIMVHILRDVAILDVADFVRLARVCRRFAYLVATEDRIWQRVCVGPEFGFGGMHYHWQRGIAWEPLGGPLHEMEDGEVLTDEQLARRQADEGRAATNALLNTSLYNGSWQLMFRRRPRMRFNGCYISTVNYIRSGQASGHQITWNSPVHIVTYYRYLRLYRDGTLISLLTTSEPADVVHHLTKDLVEFHRGGAAAHLPSALMSHAYKGRWRLSSTLDNPEASLSEMEGDLFVETEGVGKYMYRMELALKTAGKGARNNKLVWKGFWNYNKLTDDWGDFRLTNDKPFFFSRVKSYGAGE